MCTFHLLLRWNMNWGLLVSARTCTILGTVYNLVPSFCGFVSLHASLFRSFVEYFSFCEMCVSYSMIWFMQVAGYKTQDCNVAAISDSVWYLWFCVALSSVAENMRIKHIWLTYFWAFPEDFNTYNSGERCVCGTCQNFPLSCAWSLY